MCSASASGSCAVQLLQPNYHSAIPASGWSEMTLFQPDCTGHLICWYAVLMGRLTLFGNSWGMISPTKKIFLFNIFENIDIVPWVGKIRRSKGYLDIYRISSAVLFKKGFSPHQRSSLWNTSLYLIYAFVQNNNCSGVVNIPHDVCNVDPQNCIRHCGQFIDP